MVHSVPDAIDALYQAPLGQFTGERNALAAALRRAGDRDNAERVKALPKPSATAWAVNQAWWRHQTAFCSMLEAGAHVRAAHLAWVHGRGGDVRAAVDARQRAVNAIVKSAIGALGDAGKVSADARHRIAGTIEGLASGGVPEGLTPGHLSVDVHSTGLEALSALAGVLPMATSPPQRFAIVSRTSPPPDRPEPVEATKTRAAHEAHEKAIALAGACLAEREASMQAATADVAQSGSDERGAREALKIASARVAALEQQLETARDNERTARRAVAHAAKDMADAEMTRARAARDAAGARQQLDTLRKGR